jgi:hypothetical protein
MLANSYGTGGGFRFPTARDPRYSFWPFFALFFAFSFLYAQFWIWGLEANHSREVFKHTFSFGDFIGIILGVTLVMMYLDDLRYQMSRLARATHIFALFGTLIDEVFDGISMSPNLSIQTILAPGQTRDVSTIHAVRQLISMILSTMLVFLWQLVSRKKDVAETYPIVGSIAMGQEGVSQIPSVYRNRIETSGERNVSLAMLNLVSRRVTAMSAMTRDSSASDVFRDLAGTKKVDSTSPMVINVNRQKPQMIENAATINATISALRTAISEMSLLEEFTMRYWISVTIKVLGVLYLLALPAITWPSQGAWVIMSYPSIFFVVGLFLATDIYVGCIFQSPTTAHMDRTYGHLQRLAATSSFRYRERFGTKDVAPDRLPLITLVTQWFPATATATKMA